MDTTTSTIGGGEDLCKTGYVSCIKVDGKPILPPLMTEERRQEMRRYKEMALLKEKELHERKTLQTTVQKEGTFSMPSPNPVPLQTVELEAISVAASTLPVTSTPRSHRVHSSFVDSPGKADESMEESPPDMSPVPGNKSHVPEGVLRERKIIVPPFDLDKSVDSEPVFETSMVDYDAEMSSESGGESCENFASAASSTGTFVIRKDETIKVGVESAALSSNVASSEEDLDNENKHAPPTVVRKPSFSDSLFKRKRPTKYFDIDDKENTEKVNIPKPASSNLPNSVPEEVPDGGKIKAPVSTHTQFSPVAHTNFTAMAESLTYDFTQKFGTIIPSSSLQGNQPSASNYEIRLSRDIPSSAEKDKDKSDDDSSNSSNKENIGEGESGGRKHVRKLSYTLATPSAVLLEVVSREKNFPQTLETIPSAPGSMGVPSTYHTPEKPKHDDSHHGDLNPYGAFVAHEDNLDFLKRDRINSTLVKLKELNLGQGKQAHLERFLVDQDQPKEDIADISSSAGNTGEVDAVLKRMQKEHELKLQQLAEQHRLQEHNIRQEFQCELEKLKEKFSSSLNTTRSSKSVKTSPNSLLDSMNSSGRSPRPHTAASVGSLLLSEDATSNSKMLTSGMSGISIVDQSKSDEATLYFVGGNGKYFTTSISSATPSTGVAGTADLAGVGVGLSKLQSRMQLMSPGLFRAPVDARSPLLKGLVFPDPLDKPKPPIRIPQKAYDASMKPKFDRLSAAVKGYLTRRLLNSEKVQIIVQTIRDTVDLVLKLYEEAPMIGSKQTIKPQDVELHQRLIQQLTGACQSFHDVFFKLSTKERMAIIATDREKLRAKAMRHLASPARRNISNATLKSLERRMSHRSPSRKERETRRTRNSTRSYDPHALGSQSVKPKPVKTYNISPKRRRMSYLEDRNTVRRSTTTAGGTQDHNGNNFKSSLSARSQSSALARLSRIYQPSSNLGSETFIVPSQTSRGLTTSGSSSARKDSSIKTTSARSTLSSVSTASTSNASRPRVSLSRQPWNSGRH